MAPLNPYTGTLLRVQGFFICYQLSSRLRFVDSSAAKESSVNNNQTVEPEVPECPTRMEVFSGSQYFESSASSTVSQSRPFQEQIPRLSGVWNECRVFSEIIFVG